MFCIFHSHSRENEKCKTCNEKCKKSRAPPLRFRDYLYGWLLPIGGPSSDRIDADLTVERVLRGDPRSTPIKLRYLRFETPEELKGFPDRYAFHNQLRVRVGYDGRRGD